MMTNTADPIAHIFDRALVRIDDIGQIVHESIIEQDFPHIDVDALLDATEQALTIHRGAAPLCDAPDFTRAEVDDITARYPFAAARRAAGLNCCAGADA